MKKRILALILAFSMVISTFTGCSSSSSTGDASVELTSDEQIFTDTAGDILGGLHSDNSGKEETVYVIADADGNTTKTIVSEWLKNANGSDTLKDSTTLSDITNVKTNGTYTQNADGTITWDTEGEDVYYQGYSNKQLPIDVRIQYTLDGKSVQASELDGATGHLKIRIDYNNNMSKLVDINGEQVNIYQPFMTVSGTLFDNDKVSNVEVTNGEVVNSGEYSVVMGVAMPGLESSLGIDELEDSDGKKVDVDIPDSVEIEADVKDFSLISIITVASNNALSKLGLDDVDSVDDLKDSMDDLREATDELIDGANDLNDGMQELNDGVGDLDDGVNDLNDGAKQVNDGAKELNDGASDLEDGAKQVNDGAEQVNDGADQLASGIGTLKTSVASLPAGVTQLYEGALAVKTALKSGVDISKVSDTSKYGIYEGILAIQNGAMQMSAGLASGDTSSAKKYGILEASKAIETGVTEISKNLTTIKGAADSINTGVSSLNESLSVFDKSDADNANAVVKDALTRLSNVSTALEAASSDNAETANAGLTQIQATVKEINTIVNAVPDDDPDKEKLVNLVNQLNTQVSTQLSHADTLQDSLKADKASVDTIYKKLSVVSGLLTNFDSIKTGISSISTAATAISDGTQKIIDAINNELLPAFDSMQSGIEKLVAAANTISTTCQTLLNGLDTLLSDSNFGAIISGLKTLSTSSNSLLSGINKLLSGSTTLSDGTGSLENGTQSLYEGTQTLSDGTQDLYDGTQKLYDGTQTLDDSMVDLVDGVSELLDGTSDLVDGVKEYDEEAIQEIIDLVNDDLDGTYQRVKAVNDYAEEYTSYGGCLSDMDSNVTFVYKTDSIGE